MGPLEWEDGRAASEAWRALGSCAVGEVVGDAALGPLALAGLGRSTQPRPLLSATLKDPTPVKSIGTLITIENIVTCWAKNDVSKRCGQTPIA